MSMTTTSEDRPEIAKYPGGEALYRLRHSAAHVLATAVTELFPEVKVAGGPPIENGFYYDFAREQGFTPEDLERIEARMREIVAADQAFEYEETWREEAQRPFASAADLEAYLRQIEEALKRDHRRLGKDLDLFSVHEEVGGGLIHWHPKLGMVRHLIEQFWKEKHLERGYQLVYTPHIASEKLY